MEPLIWTKHQNDTQTHSILSLPLSLFLLTYSTCDSQNKITDLSSRSTWWWNLFPMKEACVMWFLTPTKRVRNLISCNITSPIYSHTNTKKTLEQKNIFHQLSVTSDLKYFSCLPLDWNLKSSSDNSFVTLSLLDSSHDWIMKDIYGWKNTHSVSLTLNHILMKSINTNTTHMLLSLFSLLLRRFLSPAAFDLLIKRTEGGLLLSCLEVNLSL